MSRVWFNGDIIDGDIALDPRDRGFALGDGLFETMLIVNHTPLWANMHLARMESAALELGIRFDRRKIDKSIAVVLEDTAAHHHVLRVTLSRGSGARGLAGTGSVPSLLITLDDFDAQLMFQPVTLITSAIRRSTASPSTRLKTLSYIDNVAAAREASARGIDDALMLNTEGHAACTTIANLFLVKDKKLITPSTDEGILNGVTRQVILASASHLGFIPEERAVKPAELAKADAVFLTNSLRLIRPVKSIDKIAVETIDLSGIIDLLCDSARLQCGRDPRLI